MMMTQQNALQHQQQQQAMKQSQGYHLKPQPSNTAGSMPQGQSQVLQSSLEFEIYIKIRKSLFFDKSNFFPLPVLIVFRIFIFLCQTASTPAKCIACGKTIKNVCHVWYFPENALI